MSDEKDAKPPVGVTVNVNQALDQVSKTGWAMEAGRVFESLFGMAADGLSLRRQARLLRLEEKLQKKLTEGDISRRQLDDALTTEVMLGASTTDDDELLTLWAQLLASAHAGVPVDAFLASCLRRLDPTCVAILNQIGEDFESDRAAKIESARQELSNLPGDDPKHRKLEADLERLRTRNLNGWSASKSDLVDQLEQVPGSVREALDRLVALGLIDQEVDSVVNANGHGYGDADDPENVDLELDVEVDVFYSDKVSVTRLGSRLWSTVQPREDL
ncbi:MAG: hypothetical protein KC431_09160 [Myxococcales bacterium]|nr:hypothetical protein [Myxococcales bacterium]